MPRHCPDCDAQMEDDSLHCWCPAAGCTFRGYVVLQTGKILREPDDRPRQMPAEIYAWPSNMTPGGETALTGSWGARRHYTDEAVRYVRADD